MHVSLSSTNGLLCYREVTVVKTFAQKGLNNNCCKIKPKNSSSVYCQYTLPTFPTKFFYRK